MFISIVMTRTSEGGTSADQNQAKRPKTSTTTNSLISTMNNGDTGTATNTSTQRNPSGTDNSTPGNNTNDRAQGEQDVDMTDDETVVQRGAAPVSTMRCKMKLTFVGDKDPNAKVVNLLKEFLQQSKVVDGGMLIAPWYDTPFDGVTVIRQQQDVPNDSRY